MMRRIPRLLITIAIALLPAAADLAAAERTPDAPPLSRQAVAPGAAEPAQAPIPVVERVTPERRLVWTWLGLGLAAGAGVAAALVGDDARAKEAAFRATVEQARTEPRSAAEVSAMAATARQRALAANVLWGVTGGLAATAVAVFCLEYLLPAERADGSAVGVAPAAGPGGAGVIVETRF